MESVVMGFAQLPLVYQKEVPDNDWGKENASYLVITHKGSVVHVGSDAMEPEDATFTRDLRWVANIIITAYRLGVSDSKEGGEKIP